MDISAPSSVEKLLNILRTLRSPEGCPWDRKQTHQSLVPYTMEECAEFMDSAAEGDYRGMCEELGDILMHVVLHSVVAEEKGEFTLDDVVDGICKKMIRRHPHVFGEIAKVDDAEEVVGLWEEVKAQEKIENNTVRKSVLDGIPRNYPALLKAHKICLKAAKYGFDWPDVKGVREKLNEEWNELQEALDSGDEAHIDEELGDLIFVLTSLARLRQRDHAEELLSKTVDKFRERFSHIEKRVTEAGRTLEDATLDEMEALWQEAKRNKRQGQS